MIRLLTVCCLALLCLMPGQIQAQQKFNPSQSSHIVLLGNTFADRMRHYGYFETLLQTNFPGRQLTLRNMGWSADEVGLQPRPLNFPGFRNSQATVSEQSEQVSFQRYKFEGERIVMPVALNFDGLHQDLEEQKADIIFLCFGMNESFKGQAGLAAFERDLETFTGQLLSKKYNGRTAPQLILVSPIAHEALGGFMPDPDEHNQNLALYTDKMKAFAAGKGMLFLDLYAPSRNAMAAKGKQGFLTINGIHLTQNGYQLAAGWMGKQLGFAPKTLALDLKGKAADRLTKVVKMKDDHFFYRWRAVNGEYIYGRRREPFGVLSFPPELQKLNRMTASLDSVIWQMVQKPGDGLYEKAKQIVDERGRNVADLEGPKVVMTGRQGAAHSMTEHHEHQPTRWPATTEKFTVPEGYQINLFASEKDFPIEKPVAMNFDARGRLWVATMPTYPQYYPGVPVHDKLVVLEDTNGDGKADKHTVFAEDLYLPLGFEFYNGGILVSQEPDILFLKDTDGDGKADVREVILTGFGSEDSHHATHAFTFGQDGALYFNEGTFLNTQVETPYGPVRSYAGATYRYEPRTGKLDDYISYPYYNPWGSVFDRWGTHLIGDASDGSNYFAPPMTGHIAYPDKHPRINMFTTTRVRPTAGIEIVSSRQFPDEVQGDFLVNNNIGFQGTKQHRIIRQGSGITSQEVTPILQSSDPNFRPIDLKFGPDGGLYVVDWYNPLVSHGENPPRDPMRDKLHGRVWRITYKNKPLLKREDVSKKDITELLNLLKEHEDRLRYRTRARLRELPATSVLPALKTWTTSLDPKAPQYENHLLEALWLHQDFQSPEPELLKKLLNGKDDRTRAAAVRVLRYWKSSMPDYFTLMQGRIQDPSQRVRLEAVVALSHVQESQALEVALDVFKGERDYYLDYAINETFRYKKGGWLTLFQENRFPVNDNAARYLLGTLSLDELKSLPEQRYVQVAMLTRSEIDQQTKQAILEKLAKRANISVVDQILSMLRQTDQDASPVVKQALITSLLSQPKELVNHWEDLYKLTGRKESAAFRGIGFATLLTADQSDESVFKLAVADSTSAIAYLEGIRLLTDAKLQTTFYEKVKNAAVDGRLTASQPVVRAVSKKAYEVLGIMPVREQETAKLVASLIGTDRTSEVIAIIASADQNWQRSYAGPVVTQIITSLSSTGRNQPLFYETIALGKKLAVLLPEAERNQALAQLGDMDDLEVKIAALPAKMLFDKEEIVVKKNRMIALTFENPDMMPHNVVIVKPGAMEKVGEAADAMAALKNGFEKNFIPDLQEVLFSTPLVNTGQSFTLRFKAPSEPGLYPYICSFPGHWRVMKGILKVE